MQLEKREHIGQFGSLRDSMARALQDPSALLVSRNTYHDITGAIEKRRGYEFHAEVADQAEATCTPVIAATTGGNLKNSVLYYIRYTYVTAAGETDDLHSGDDSSPGPVQSSVEMTGGNNAITIGVPFHLRGATISDHEVLTDTTSRFKLDQTPVGLSADTCVVGWLVYSRSPRKQDETHLGINCAPTEPTYHRNEHAADGVLGRVTAYDSGTGWWTIDSGREVGNSPFPDDNTLDIMMPDREGLPIRYFNAYISSDNEDYYYAGSGVSMLTLVTITDHDITATGAPSTRVPRSAPTVTAVDYTEDPRDGRCGAWAVKTGIEPGLYSVRVTYNSDDGDVMRPPGMEAAQALLGEPVYCYPMRTPQETWPSCRAVVCVSDGQGIQVVPTNMPDDLSYTDWRIYTTQIEPFGELTFNGTTRIGGILDTADNNSQPFAYYYPDRDLAFDHATVVDRLADIATLPPIGTGTGTDDESGPGNSAAYEEFRTGPANACVSPTVDPVLEDWGANTPSYEDISQPFQVTDTDGDPVWSFASSRDDTYGNRMDFNFHMQEEANWANAEKAIFFIRMRVTGRGSNTYYRPSLASSSVTISHYDYDAAAPVVLKNADFNTDQNFYTYYFCIDDPVTKAKTYDTQEFLSFFVHSINGTPFDVMEVGCWLYNSDAVCGNIKTILDARGVYDLQTAGGDPEDFGAWYSGDSDELDAAIEAAITAANIDTIEPFNARNTPWEEYGPDIIQDNSNVPGAVFDPFAGSLTMGSAGAGLAYANHLPADYPGIQYANFSLTGYTITTDYTFDKYTGLITSVTIPDDTVMAINYDLPYAAWNTSQTAADLTEGWTPTYVDILKNITDDPRCAYDDSPLWASTRQNVDANRHHWWFRCDDADLSVTPDYLRVEIKFRTRDGGTGGLGAWDAGADTSRKIRLWDQAAFDISAVVSTSWIDLEVDVGGADILDTWVTRSYAIPYTDIRKSHNCGTLNHGLAGTHKYFILDMAGWDYNGFDVDYVQIAMDYASTDPRPGKDELLRDKVDYGTTSWTLRNPMLEKPIITSTASHCAATDFMPRQGEWCPIRRNTTGQWPAAVGTLPTVFGAGSSADNIDNYVACGDSVFVDRGGGELDRVYHSEGEFHGRVMTHDWEFSNYLTRAFFCNPGDPRYNYRYDGVQTWPHGLGWPYNYQEELDGDVDISGNYNPPGRIDDEQDPNDPDCFLIGELPAADTVTVTQIDTPDGEVPPGEEAPVQCHDVEYYYQTLRILRTGGRSYIVRSRPRLLTETIEVCVHSSQLPTVKVTADICPEPQATHIEIFRNFKDTARYFKVDRIPIDEGHLDADTMRMKLVFEDTIPESDEDLTVPMFLETGRPRAARMMKFHQGRLWMVPQAAGLVVDFTNVTDPGGSVDPEGWWPFHFVIPPMRESAAITCLSPYSSSLLVHSRQGICAVRGVSSNQNDPSAIVSTALHAHAGFVGPHAYCVIDSTVVGITHEGPAIVVGDEAKIFGTDDIDMEDFLWDGPTAYNTNCLHYRAKGISQVWFTYTDDPMKPAGHKVLVFDKASDDTASGGLTWKKWDSLPLYSADIARGRCGDEYPLMGGTDGRLYDYGSVRTDCGLFIESEFVTGWYDELTGGKSHQPDVNYWRVDGHIDDVVFLDVRKDGVNQFLDYEGIPIHMGGTISTTEEDDATLTRRTWDENHMWNDGGIWRDKDKGYDEDRTHHRGIFRTVQYRLYQSRELLPAGVDMGMTYRITGFIPFHRVYAPTSAAAGV